MHRFTTFVACLFFTGIASLQAAPILVAGSSTYAGLSDGALVTWTHTFTTGSSDVTIQSIKIILKSGLFFDTSAAAPGFGTNQNVGTTNLGGTGFSGFSASGGALNGGNTVTLTFTDFNTGETYTHTGDVDQNATLQNCSGLSVGAAIACNASNAILALGASIVDGSEFEGSQIEVTIGGSGYTPLVVSSAFVQTGVLSARADWSGTVVPEPSTYAMTGLGLAAAVWMRRRQSLR